MSGTGWRYLSGDEMRALVASSKPALSNDTETSDAAARTVAPRRTKYQRIVLAALAQGDATADELELRTGLRGNTVRPRLVELVEANVIERTDQRRPTRTGSMAFVYQLR